MSEQFSRWQLVRNLVERSTVGSEAEDAVVGVLDVLDSKYENILVSVVLDAIASAYCVQFESEVG